MVRDRPICVFCVFLERDPFPSINFYCRMEKRRICTGVPPIHSTSKLDDPLVMTVETSNVS